MFLVVISSERRDQCIGGEGEGGSVVAVDDNATTPNTRPRTLELYAGRGGWSANLVRKAATPGTSTGIARRLHHRLRKSRISQCHRACLLQDPPHPSELHPADFLDFAMAGLRDDVNVGDLHALADDRLLMFTDLAKSCRRACNAFAGIYTACHKPSLPLPLRVPPPPGQARADGLVHIISREP